MPIFLVLVLFASLSSAAKAEVDSHASSAASAQAGGRALAGDARQGALSETALDGYFKTVYAEKYFGRPTGAVLDNLMTTQGYRPIPGGRGGKMVGNELFLTEFFLSPDGPRVLKVKWFAYIKPDGSLEIQNVQLTNPEEPIENRAGLTRKRLLGPGHEAALAKVRQDPTLGRAFAVYESTLGEPSTAAMSLSIEDSVPGTADHAHSYLQFVGGGRYTVQLSSFGRLVPRMSGKDVAGYDDKIFQLELQRQNIHGPASPLSGSR